MKWMKKSSSTPKTVRKINNSKPRKSPVSNCYFNRTKSKRTNFAASTNTCIRKWIPRNTKIFARYPQSFGKSQRTGPGLLIQALKQARILFCFPGTQNFCWTPNPMNQYLFQSKISWKKHWGEKSSVCASQINWLIELCMIAQIRANSPKISSHRHLTWIFCHSIFLNLLMI